MLSETVERNKDCRINVAKTGYIIESDPFWWNEDLYFEGVLDLFSLSVWQHQQGILEGIRQPLE